MKVDEAIGFNVAVVGDRTGTFWEGVFSAFPRLSHRQELTRDRICRDLLGGTVPPPNPDGTVTRAVEQAEVFSDLQVSLVVTPQWWRDAGFGLDLEDNTVVREVYRNVIRIREESLKESQKKAQEASERLKQKASEFKPEGQ